MPKTKDYSIREATQEDVIDLTILGKQFAKESKTIDYLGWNSIKVHNSLLDAINREDLAVIVLECNSEVVGMLITFVAPCFFSDAIQATEIVWYVTPEHRGSIKAYGMLSIFEKWAKSKGAVCVNLMNLDILNGDKVAKIYYKRGYKLTENTFVKEL